MIAVTDMIREKCTKVDEQIRTRTDKSVACYGSAGPDAIGRRLGELDREWDEERAWEVAASAAAVGGAALGVMFRGRWWAMLPLLAGGGLLLHAMRRWHPPVPLFRALGFRPEAEIDRERFALKAIRGDFQGLPTMAREPDKVGGVDRILEAVRR